MDKRWQLDILGRVVAGLVVVAIARLVGLL